MSYQKVLEIAQTELTSKYDFVIQDLKHCIASGSTGGEISSIVGRYLLDLRKENYEVYRILEADIQNYIKECQHMGIIFE